MTLSYLKVDIEDRRSGAFRPSTPEEAAAIEARQAARAAEHQRVDSEREAHKARLRSPEGRAEAAANLERARAELRAAEAESAHARGRYADAQMAYNTARRRDLIANSVDNVMLAPEVEDRLRGEAYDRATVTPAQRELDAQRQRAEDERVLRLVEEKVAATLRAQRDGHAVTSVAATSVAPEPTPEPKRKRHW